MNYRWAIAPASPAAEEISAVLRISKLLAQCLINRGLASPEPISKFLRPRLQHLEDPFRLPHMDRAVRRLWEARARGETVVIFGDYDVDGVTSTAILMEVLEVLGWKVRSYLPSRLDEGYGLSAAAVSNCLGRYSPNVLLAVDCGSNAVEVIAKLQNSGIDVLVLDHHQVADPAPAACALVNPKADPSGEPFRELCSAGLAFKLAHALVKEGRAGGVAACQQYDLRNLLDLVALGTIADLVSLTGENRILVSAGLERLNRTSRPGLAALRAVSGFDGPITVYQVAFGLAPRLNAAGRLETAEKALQLIRARNAEEAEAIAQELDGQNRERQRLERETFDQAAELVRARFSEQSWVIVEGDSRWHIGVVGIVAARILRQFYRPTIIFGGEGTLWRGSGRSIEGFDLAGVLGECGQFLVKHGGHAMAAGVTMAPANLDALRERLNALARDRLQPENLQPVLRADAEVSLSTLTLEQMIELQQLQPHGQGNPEVQLVLRRMRRHRSMQRMGKMQQHLRFWVTDCGSRCEAVCWNAPVDGPPEQFDLAAAPSLHEYQNDRSVQLKVLDWIGCQ